VPERLCDRVVLMLPVASSEIDENVDPEPGLIDEKLRLPLAATSRVGADIRVAVMLPFPLLSGMVITLS